MREKEARKANKLKGSGQKLKNMFDEKSGVAVCLVMTRDTQ